jgi:hypothetical protein
LTCVRSRVSLKKDNLGVSRRATRSEDNWRLAELASSRNCPIDWRRLTGVWVAIVLREVVVTTNESRYPCPLDSKCRWKIGYMWKLTLAESNWHIVDEVFSLIDRYLCAHRFVVTKCSRCCLFDCSFDIKQSYILWRYIWRSGTVCDV